MGEDFGRWTIADADAILADVTSANVACGFHAGDPSAMRRVCGAAARRGVTIGAHVGYRDLVGFGRRFIDVEPDRLHDDVAYQIAALQGFARAAGTTIRYLKPHGALYGAVIDHDHQALAVVGAAREHGDGLALVGPQGSALLAHAQAAGLSIVQEAFADRAYLSAGRLVPRDAPGAVLTDPEIIAARCVRMVTDGEIQSQAGDTIRLRPASICLHGDTPGAAAIARAVRRALDEARVVVRSFV